MALRNVGKAMKLGTSIYILAHIIDNSRLSPLGIVSFNLYFLNIYESGQAYIEQEHVEWLEEAGLGQYKRVLLPNGESVATGRKLG